MLCENIKNANDRKIVMFYLICIHHNNILIYKSLFIEYSIKKKKCVNLKLEFLKFVCL